MSDDDLFRQVLRDVSSPLWQRRMQTLMLQTQLKSMLDSNTLAADLVVLVTDDGRTLDRRSDGSLILDVGDNPKLWKKSEADSVYRAWNHSSLGAATPATALPWREHFGNQIQRLDLRLASMK